MTDPVSLAAVGIGSSALGGLTSAFGASYAGNAQAAMYNYQAGVARINSQLAKQDATYAREVGEVQAQESGMRTAARVGETKAIQGAGNIDVNTGSAAAVRSSETGIGQFEESVIRSNAAKRAFGFDVKSAAETAQAGAYGVAAQTSKTAGTLGAISSIIGGAGQVSSRWLQAKQTGIFPDGGDSGAVTWDVSGLG